MKHETKLNIAAVATQGAIAYLTSMFRRQPKAKHHITRVGAGTRHGMQHNTSKAGIKYTKLVKTDGPLAYPNK